MAADKEVLREIWDGRLPVCFVLTSEEVYDLQTPEPYYLMVPRLSYFPLVWDKVRKHFIKHIHPDRQELEMWLDFNGTPIKWHYPIGVLFDLYSLDIQLPWTLTVHFEKFPENKILHCTNKETVEFHFISTIKEADTLKHRGQVISEMQKKELMQLWLGLQNDKFDQFWSINKKLMESKEFRCIPFRCYTNDETPFIQKPIKPYTDDGDQKTLENLITELYPNDYSTVSAISVVQWIFRTALNCSSLAREIHMITHGIKLPWNIPLQWLSEHLSYPDNFLHLYVFKNTSPVP